MRFISRYDEDIMELYDEDPQERENERFILETFISDISKKKMESYKSDAEHIVEWVKSGKNLIVYV